VRVSPAFWALFSRGRPVAPEQPVCAGDWLLNRCQFCSCSDVCDVASRDHKSPDQLQERRPEMHNKFICGSSEIQDPCVTEHASLHVEHIINDACYLDVLTVHHIVHLED
jgi:hypothetical protein